jgi:hypothetical protein
VTIEKASTQEHDKKQEERLCLDCFKAAWAEFPPGTIRESETPDFLVSSERAIVGIEVTRLFRETVPPKAPLQIRESVLQNIVQTAKQIHIDNRQPPVCVSAFFSPHHDFRKRDILENAKSLAEIVARNLPEIGEREEEFDGTNRHYFPETIHHVIVRRYPEIQENFWSAPEAAFCPKSGAELLQAAIKRKEGTYERCRSQCDQAWLLLVADAGRLSSIVSLTDAALRHVYVSRFDRAFLMRRWRQVTELSLHPR